MRHGSVVRLILGLGCGLACVAAGCPASESPTGDKSPTEAEVPRLRIHLGVHDVGAGEPQFVGPGFGGTEFGLAATSSRIIGGVRHAGYTVFAEPPTGSEAHRGLVILDQFVVEGREPGEAIHWYVTAGVPFTIGEIGGLAAWDVHEMRDPAAAEESIESGRVFEPGVYHFKVVERPPEQPPQVEL